eukprot:11176949-Lingulodinium_polyedra.AAC.1
MQRLQLRAVFARDIKRALRCRLCDGQCVVCASVFWTRERLLHHVVRSGRCQQRAGQHLLLLIPEASGAADAA